MSAQDLENEPESESAASKTRLMSLSDLDGRTAAAKAAKTLIRELESDLGGADRLTAGERAIVGRAAVTTAMVEDMEARWLLGRPIDVAAYCALVNVQRRLLTTVGLQRRPHDVTPDLQSYIAAQREPVTVLPPPPPFRAPPR